MKYSGLVVNLIFGTGICILFYWEFSKTEKIVFVNDGLVSQKYQEMIDAKAVLEKKSKIIQSNIDTLTSELQRAIAEYEKNKLRLSDKEKNLNEQLLNSKQQQLIQYRDAVQKRAIEEEQKMMENIAEKMNLFMVKYAKEQNYKLVLGSNILYGKPDMDITENVIDGLNKEYVKNNK